MCFFLSLLLVLLPSPHLRCGLHLVQVYRISSLLVCCPLWNADQWAYLTVKIISYLTDHHRRHLFYCIPDHLEVPCCGIISGRLPCINRVGYSAVQYISQYKYILYQPKADVWLCVLRSCNTCFWEPKTRKEV